MHTIQIIWFLSWPVSIIISYFAVKWVIGRYEKRAAKVATGMPDESAN